MQRFFVKQTIVSSSTNVYSVQAESTEKAIELIKSGHYTILDSEEVVNSPEFTVIESPIKNNNFKLRKEFQEV